MIPLISITVVTALVTVSTAARIPINPSARAAQVPNALHPRETGNPSGIPTNPPPPGPVNAQPGGQIGVTPVENGITLDTRFTQTTTGIPMPTSSDIVVYPRGDSVPSDGIYMAFGPDLQNSLKSAISTNCAQGYTQNCYTSIYELLGPDLVGDQMSYIKDPDYNSALFAAIAAGFYMHGVKPSVYLPVDTMNKIQNNSKGGPNDMVFSSAVNDANPVTIIMTVLPARPVPTKTIDDCWSYTGYYPMYTRSPEDEQPDAPEDDGSLKIREDYPGLVKRKGGSAKQVDTFGTCKIPRPASERRWHKLSQVPRPTNDPRDPGLATEDYWWVIDIFTNEGGVETGGIVCKVAEITRKPQRPAPAPHTNYNTRYNPVGYDGSRRNAVLGVDHIYERSLLADFFGSALKSGDSTAEAQQAANKKCEDFSQIMNADVAGAEGPYIQKLWDLIPNKSNKLLAGLDNRINSVKGALFNPGLAGLQNPQNTDKRLQLLNEIGMAIKFLEQENIRAHLRTANTNIYHELLATDRAYSNCGLASKWAEEYKNWITGLLITNQRLLQSRAQSMYAEIAQPQITLNPDGTKNKYGRAHDEMTKTYPPSVMTLDQVGLLGGFSVPAATAAPRAISDICPSAPIQPPVKTCIGVGVRNYYLSSTELRTHISMFCARMAPVIRGSRSGNEATEYGTNSLEHVKLSIKWPKYAVLSNDECNRMFNELNDGCDVDHPPESPNPKNYKRGGTYTENNIEFSVEPMAVRPPAPTIPKITSGSNYGSCQVTSHGSTGKDGKVLDKDQLQACLQSSTFWQPFESACNDGAVRFYKNSNGQWMNSRDLWDACVNCISDAIDNDANSVNCDAWSGGAHAWLGFDLY